jgi:tRNA dimethylallyltransferase
MKLVAAIVGPTGIGKSKLGLLLARTLDAEIVNADSRQIYRYMDIGTAKPNPEERASVPHHLVDIVDPDEDFSLALYRSLAYSCVEDIIQRGKLPILVGGSGLHAWAILEGWNIPEVPPNPDFRRQMEKTALAEGVDALYRRLESIDPVSAGRMNPQNLRRIIRALEIYEATHRPPSRLQGKTQPGFDTLIVGLTADRQRLYQMIDHRVDDMIQRGLVAEVKGLVDKGYGIGLPSMSSVGYRQIGQFIRGESDLSTAIRQIKFETHRFARHQYAWFRLTDPRIRWFDIKDNIETHVLNLVREKIRYS